MLNAFSGCRRAERYCEQRSTGSHADLFHALQEPEHNVEITRDRLEAEKLAFSLKQQDCVAALNNLDYQRRFADGPLLLARQL